MSKSTVMFLLVILFEGVYGITCSSNGRSYKCNTKCCANGCCPASKSNLTLTLGGSVGPVVFATALIVIIACLKHHGYEIPINVKGDNPPNEDVTEGAENVECDSVTS